MVLPNHGRIALAACEDGRASQLEAGLRFLGAPGLRKQKAEAVHGWAFGEKSPMGRPFAVRNPAGASRITGIEFTATDAVAMSPCEPPGIVRLIVGWPVSVTVSAGSFAPTYISSSM